MSLINQMLKDLAKSDKHGARPELILKGLEVSTQTKRVNSSLFYLIVVAILVNVFLLWYLTQKIMDDSKSPIMHPPVQTLQANIGKENNELVVNPAFKTSSLTGMTMEVKDNKTELHLMLNQPILYRVNDKDKNEVQLVLEGTELQAALPQIDKIKSAFDYLKIADDHKHNLYLTIGLKQGAEIKELTMIEGQSYPELKLAVEHQTSVESSFAQGIKTPSSNDHSEEGFQEILTLMDEGRVQTAMHKLGNFLQQYPFYTPARKTYINLLLNEGDTITAQKELDIGLKQQPTYPPYVQMKAQILADQGKVREAIQLLKKSPPAVEDYPEYHSLLAALYQRDNAPELAEKVYEKLTDVQPNNSVWWMGLGIARENLKKNSAALDAYAKATVSDNLTPELKVYVEKRIGLLS